MFFTLFHASLLQTKASAAAAGSEVIVTTVKETDEETNNFENLAKIKEIQKDIISLLDSSMPTSLILLSSFSRQLSFIYSGNPFLEVFLTSAAIQKLAFLL